MNIQQKKETVTIEKPKVQETKKEPEKPIQILNEKVIQGSIEYSEDELINMLIQSTIPIKEEVKEKFTLIENYKSKPAYKYACGLLIDGNVCAASKKSILLAYDIKSQANILNSKNAQIKVREFIKELFKGN